MDISADLSDGNLRRTFHELGFLTGSDLLLPLLRMAYRAAKASDINILIEGETGTGKQVLASAIHQLDSKRGSCPLVTAQAGTISDPLVESELFGHQRGAFSGAHSDRKGLFRSAAGGTLFLDDISDLSPKMQSSLLDVLQRHMVRPVGSDREMRIDVRIIAATNRPLLELVNQGHFRLDLYQRLDVVRLRLPPLRERAQDMETLLLALAKRHAGLYPRPIERAEPELVHYLEGQLFPGNIRELENCVKRMLFLKAQGTTLTMSDWASQSPTGELSSKRDPIADAAASLLEAVSQQNIPYGLALQRVEDVVLQSASNGQTSIRKVAEFLQTSERTVYRKMRASQESQKGAQDEVCQN
jgi:transcriptional regulator with PAS, ATPase and Fis domain